MFSGRSRSSSASSTGSGNYFSTASSRTQVPTSMSSRFSYKSPGMMGGMGGALLAGIAFGAGSDVAHNVIRGVTG